MTTLFSYLPRRWTVCAALLMPATLAVASPTEEDELALIYGDKTLVSIATGSAQSLRRAPAVATVITAEDIAAMLATDLDQVLETVPGLHVARSAINYEPLYVVRGIYSVNNAQILVLQNGVPMTTLMTSSRGTIWGGYPVEHIARIEIIRGPGSALYGADAYSGVINIITRTAADSSGTRVKVGAASFRTRDASVLHGGKVGDVDVAAYLRIGSTDGFREIISADAQSARDKIFKTAASLAPGPVNVGYDAVDANVDIGYDKWRVRAGYKLRGDVGTGAGVGSALDPVGKEKSERITLDASWTDPQFANDWSVGLSASALGFKQRILTDLRLSPPGTRFPTGLFPDGFIGHPDTSERQIRLSGYAMYSGFASHKLRLGLGHDDLDLYQTRTIKNYLFNAAGVPVPNGPVADYSAIQPFLLPQRRKINYVNVQDEWQFARDWSLTAGVRYDRYSDFGSTTNPRLALVWDAALDLTVKLLHGQAFRAPSFNESYGVNNPVQRGNPNLHPETIKTTETAFAWQARRDLQLNLALYRYEMKDIIRVAPNAQAGTGATFSNIGNQSSKGLELEAVWDPSRNVRLAANYALQRSIDKATHSDAGFAPRRHLAGRLDWKVAGFGMLSSSVNHVADRRRAAGDTRPPVADYTTIDLSLSSERGMRNWEWSLALRNMFNADVREPSLPTIPNDLPMARRSVYLQLIYRL